MTNDSSNRPAGFPSDRRPEATRDAFLAAVDSVLGSAANPAAPADADPGLVARYASEIRGVVDALRHLPLDPVPAGLRQKAIDLFAAQPDPIAALRRWLDSAKLVAMELLSPPTPALAGFRRGAVTVRSFHTPEGSPIDAWLDVQIDTEADALAARRLRGQVTIDAGPAPVVVHALARGAGDDPLHLLASAPIDEQGEFRLRLDAQRVDLVIELADGEGALSLPGVDLRTQ